MENYHLFSNDDDDDDDYWYYIYFLEIIIFFGYPKSKIETAHPVSGFKTI